VKLDCLERIAEKDKDVRCTCGGPMLRGFTQRASAVIADDIPGGMWVRHGLCNEDGSPRKYYSKTEMRQEAVRRGLVNIVEHTPDRKGSDRSAHTSRWI
jgi:hypothetical protein